ncbi:KR domain-containing protein [Thiofilum flexile]|uniref:KR domain-containing protein n=1 Tax=Thiofilum flexile TaxID=125627 RepID=UPI00035EAE45|nr:KR domain-containing protein [Thiofilum flexile]
MLSAHEPASPHGQLLPYYHLQAAPCAKPLVQPQSLSGDQLVIICEREDIELGQVLSGKLKGGSLKISAVSYKTLRIQPLFLKESQPQIVLVVLPRLLTIGAEEGEVRQATTRLYTVLNSLQHYQPDTLLVAQFSDGQFGLDPASAPHLEQVGWRSVLANWSSQYPQGQARLVDCDSSTPLGAWSDLVIAALQMPGTFQSLAKREDEYYQLSLVPWDVQSSESALSFKAQSVVMVLGVQSPLITIYAATLAQQTGVSLALVGQEALVANEAMQRVIQYCQQAGIRVRYYACDLTEETAVASTVQQIQSDYEAPIESVIYGTLSDDLVSNRASHSVDQVRSVMHLTHYLPKLMRWLSIAAIDTLLGAKQDYWAGYTTELIHAHLVNQRRKRPHCVVQMLALGDMPVNQSVDALLPLANTHSHYPLFIGGQEALALWGESTHPVPLEPLESVDEPPLVTLEPITASIIPTVDELSINELTPELEEQDKYLIASELEAEKHQPMPAELEANKHLVPAELEADKHPTAPELEDKVTLPKAKVEDKIAEKKERVTQPRLWSEHSFTAQTAVNEYLTAEEFGHWQADWSMEILRPVVASVLNAKPRILVNQVECLDFLVDGHQETTARVYIADFNTSRLVLKYEYWGKNASDQHYQVAQGNVILGYGARCLERWLELPFPAEVVDKIRDFLNS